MARGRRPRSQRALGRAESGLAMQKVAAATRLPRVDISAPTRRAEGGAAAISPFRARGRTETRSMRRPRAALPARRSARRRRWRRNSSRERLASHRASWCGLRSVGHVRSLRGHWGGGGGRRSPPPSLPQQRTPLPGRHERLRRRHQRYNTDSALRTIRGVGDWHFDVGADAGAAATEGWHLPRGVSLSTCKRPPDEGGGGGGGSLEAARRHDPVLPSARTRRRAATTARISAIRDAARRAARRDDRLLAHDVKSALPAVAAFRRIVDRQCCAGREWHEDRWRGAKILPHAHAIAHAGATNVNVSSGSSANCWPLARRGPARRRRRGSRAS